MLRLRMVVLTLLATLACAANASAAPGVVQNLPGCRTATLPANDDGSTAAVPLGFTANMFDTSFSSVFVNNNGNVTVDERPVRVHPVRLPRDRRADDRAVLRRRRHERHRVGPRQLRAGRRLRRQEGVLRHLGSRRLLRLPHRQAQHLPAHHRRPGRRRHRHRRQLRRDHVGDRRRERRFERLRRRLGRGGLRGRRRRLGARADRARLVRQRRPAGLQRRHEPRGPLDGGPAGRPLPVPAAPDRPHGRAAHGHRDQPRRRSGARRAGPGLPHRRRLRVADRERRRPLYRGQPACRHLHRDRLPRPRPRVLRRRR